ncbi:hypothetical protein MTR67_052452 [Solanum verrucosum]|uniref:Uncharacterized protein n=1 Tax=Solanum verrucosum TaxID=315347 RepID=A0AAF0V6Z0_SOLVR|nr:hypothetical protein MTR67_052452 [Solanum verrucosum]
MKVAESHNHLYRHCSVSTDLWSMFITLFELNWVMPQSIKDGFESWCCWKVDSTIKKIWKMIPVAIFWRI